MRNMICNILLLITLFLSCKNEAKNTDLSGTRIECDENQLKSRLFKSVIYLERIQEYIKPPEWKDRKSVAVLADSYFSNMDYDTIVKFGKPVKIIAESDTSEFKINGIGDYLKFKEISIQDDTAEVEITYDIQGIRVFSTLVKKDCDWVEINTDIAEE